MRRVKQRQVIRIDNEPTTPITKRRPAVGWQKHILCGEFPGTHLLVSPKNVTNRVVPFRKQTVRDAHRFNRFAVVDSTDFDAGVFFELVEDGLGINLILRTIGDDHLGCGYDSLSPEKQD